MFGPYYHQTGYIVAATRKAPQKAVHHLEKALDSVSSHPRFASGIRSLNTRSEFQDCAWQFSGPLNGFKGYFNRLAGYAHSGDALRGVWLHCAARGVRFITGGEKGKVMELIYDDAVDSADRRCIGIRTADGKFHASKTTICALGPYAASLIPDLGRFVVARSWSVAHVQLTKAETDLLRGVPTTNIRDLGFFFEPDPETRLFKLCPLGAGYTNTAENGTSLPPVDRLPPPQDFIPAEDERKLRRLLQEVFPWMASRPFVEQRLCWFADTRDSEYCIDFVPGTGNTLVVLSGDSGHGFKMMPIFGKWVLSLLEEGEQRHPPWKWRVVREGNLDWGDSVSWRIGRARELKELIEEKKRLERARL